MQLSLYRKFPRKGKEMSETEHTPGPIDIVFDGPPAPESGRFVEVEQDGRSISFGEWVKRDDGYWVLRLPDAYNIIPQLLKAGK